MAAPFFKGKNCVAKLFINGAAIGDSLDVKSFTCKPNKTAIADPVCGEDRDRLDAETNFFELKLECFNVNAAKLKALLQDQDNDDSGSAPTNKEFALVIKPADGSKDGFKGTEAVIDDWEFAYAGRTDRAMLSIPVRCRYFSAVAAL